MASACTRKLRRQSQRDIWQIEIMIGARIAKPVPVLPQPRGRRMLRPRRPGRYGAGRRLRVVSARPL